MSFLLFTEKLIIRLTRKLTPSPLLFGLLKQSQDILPALISLD